MKTELKLSQLVAVLKRYLEEYGVPEQMNTQIEANLSSDSVNQMHLCFFMVIVNAALHILSCLQALSFTSSSQIWATEPHRLN